MQHIRTFLISAALIAAAGAHASPVLDQSFLPGPLEFDARVGVVPLFPLEARPYQSFTVGASGLLSGVDVFVESRGNTTEALTLDIISTANPFGPVFASQTVMASGIPADPSFLSFDLSASNLTVTLGDQLSWRLRSAQDFSGNVNEYITFANMGGGYAAGEGQHWISLFGFQNDGVDFYFRTFVDSPSGQVPEPSSILLTLAALGGVCVARRRATGMKLPF